VAGHADERKWWLRALDLPPRVTSKKVMGSPSPGLGMGILVAITGLVEDEEMKGRDEEDWKYLDRKIVGPTSSPGREDE
jgi:hypothetical protein